MKKSKLLNLMVSAVLTASLICGCGSSPAGGAAEDAGKEGAAVSAVSEAAGSAGDAKSMSGNVTGPQAALNDIMSSMNRPVGDMVKDFSTEEPEEISAEEAEGMDRAMREYVPGKDSLLKNKAKEFYYYTQLTDTQQEYYDMIYMLAEDPESENNIVSTTISNSYDPDAVQEDLFTAYLAIIYDHPELFWMYNAIKTDLEFSVYTLNSETTLYIQFTDVYEDYEKDMTAFNKAAEDFLKDIDLNASELEIAGEIHDKLLDLASYDYDVAASEEVQDLAHTAYGALVQNSSGQANTCVCDGYSLAYVYLCQQAGIEAIFMGGVAGNTELDAGGHAWSMVKVDGEWKEVDTTWDDMDDMVEMIKNELNTLSDSDRKYIETALSDKEYIDALEHYLFLVSTDTITNYKPDDSVMYYFDDGAVVCFVFESVHIRANKAAGFEAMGSIIKNAPIAA